MRFSMPELVIILYELVNILSELGNILSELGNILSELGNILSELGNIVDPILQSSCLDYYHVMLEVSRLLLTW